MKQLLEEFPGLKRFLENRAKMYKSRYPMDFRNLYVIRTEDMDGNITAERYATNLITNNGLVNITTDSTGINKIRYIRIGSGTQEPSYSDTGLIAGYNITAIMDQADEYYPVQYDSVSDTLYQHRRMGSFTFDYNISGITEDLVINELGLFGNNTWTQLNARMLVYDENMQLGITKHLNEKMTIYVFFAAGMKASLIDTWWNQGRYAIINPGQLLCVGSATQRLAGYSPDTAVFAYGAAFKDYTMREESASDMELLYVLNVFGPYTMMYYGKDNRTSREGLNGSTIVSFSKSNVVLYGRGRSSNITIRTNIHQQFHYLLNSNNLHTGPYVGNPTEIINTNCELAVFRELWIPNNGTESITSERVYTSTLSSSDLTQAFGKEAWNTGTFHGQFPVLDFTITSSYMYNHEKDHKGWNISDSFINENTYYGNMGNMGFEFYSSDGKVIVFCNNKNSTLRIKSLNVTKSRPVYCTDAYWDPTTYVEIPDITNIPDDSRNLGKKKYYLQYEDDGTTYFNFEYNYDQSVHRFSNATTEITENGDSVIISLNGVNGTRLVASDTYNVIVMGDMLYALNNNKEIVNKYKLTFNLDNDANNYIAHYRDQMIIGKYFITWSLYSGPISVLNIYDISGAVSGTSPMTNRHIIDYRTNPATGDAFMTGENFSSTGGKLAYWSYSELGLFSSYDYGTNNGFVVLLGILNNSISTIPYANVKFLHVQEYTTYVLYMEPGTAVPYFHLQDLSTGSAVEEDAFSLPEGYTVNGVFGCGDYFYISTTDSYYMFMYNISTHSLIRIDKIANTSWNYSSDYRHKWNVAWNQSKVLYCPGGIFFVRENDYIRYINTENDPTVVQSFLQTSDNDSKRSTYLTAELHTFKGTNQVQVLYSSAWPVTYSNSYYDSQPYRTAGYSYDFNYNRYFKTFDMGLVLDGIGGDQPGWRTNSFFESYVTINYNNLGNYFTQPGVYKDGLVGYEMSSDADHRDHGKLKWYPKEIFFPHKMTGTTHTITSYNNPKQLYAGGYTLTITNNPDVYEETPLP